LRPSWYVNIEIWLSTFEAAMSRERSASCADVRAGTALRSASETTAAVRTDNEYIAGIPLQLFALIIVIAHRVIVASFTVCRLASRGCVANRRDFGFFFT
jgi:hypothetical protein